MADEWRVRIELTEAEPAGVFDRLFHGGLSSDGAELAEALRGRHLAVSGEDRTLVVYAGTRASAERAHAVIASELAHHEIHASESAVERWLPDEERWDNEPPGGTWEDDALERGYAPWEVRVTCRSRDDAEALERRLEEEGLEPIRRWSFVVVGADSREEAEELAERLGGEVEAGGAVVWEGVLNAHVFRPFVFFG